ncbi:aspartic proteinase CDR1-like [Typha angustifolia]|uniref:aspartic proteinase CDR1-like n=1 Tax=Typha angustifolia TaxID=59011 RepID=UPI003C2C4C28
MAFSSLLLFLSFVGALSFSSLVTKGEGFSVELVHRDSVNSPLYDPSQSPSDRIKAAALRSQARVELLRRKLSPSSSSSSNGSFQFDLFSASFEYLMSIYVGTPPREIVAIADTGSDLTWANCKPCEHCYKQNPPLFDPNKSTTYQNLRCNSYPCTNFPERVCYEGTYCKYSYGYGDQSETSGNLANETFTFKTTSGGSVEIPDISFGCSHETTGSFDSSTSGLVGLGGGKLSLISQLGPTIGRKFSYCLVPPSSDNSSSQLRFGPDAVVSGANTGTISMVPGKSGTFYTVTLEGMAVGDTKVRMGSMDIIIDSGTTLTLLEKGALNSLIDLLVSTVDLPRVEDPEGIFDLCFSYKGELAMPTIALHFGRASMLLSLSNAFVFQENGIVCLAMVGGTDFSILGNIAQANFHIGYDLKERTVTFAKTNCSHLNS